MLFYINYGCSVSRESLIVEAHSLEQAQNYAEQAAQEVYWSFDCNYPSEEDYDLMCEEGMSEDEISEIEWQDMLNDVEWLVEPFNEKNEEHMDTLREQGVPYEI